MSVNSATDLFHAGNSFFVDEDFKGALDSFNQALELEEDVAEYYSKRAAVHIKMRQYEEALMDVKASLKLEPGNVVALWRKGMACFYLEEYETARKNFKAGLATIDATKKDFAKVLSTWVRKCDAEIVEEEDSVEDEQPKRKIVEDSKGFSESDQLSSQIQVQEPVQQVRYDWYQSLSHVTVTILVRNANKDTARVDVQPENLTVEVDLPGDAEPGILALSLSCEVIADVTKITYKKANVEIKMKKKTAFQWPGLLKAEGEKVLTASGMTAPSKARPYASTKDWSKLESQLKKEEEEEKPEGDEALNKLFRDIYSKATPETRRAMNKSFQTSGGTSLSTNWDEVSKKDYEKEKDAPDGMEWRSWEGDKMKGAKSK